MSSQLPLEVIESVPVEATVPQARRPGNWLLMLFFALLFVAGIGVLGVGLFLGNTIPAARSEPSFAQVGSLAPDFELKDVATGEPVRLSSLRGRPVWLNFWATWCEACRTEMPQMRETYSRLRDKGLVIVGVDVQESPETLTNYTKEGGYNWTFVIDTDRTLLDRYVVNAIPTHWFVGRDGRLVSTSVGAMSQADLEKNVNGIMNP